MRALWSSDCPTGFHGVIDRSEVPIQEDSGHNYNLLHGHVTVMKKIQTEYFPD